MNTEQLDKALTLARNGQTDDASLIYRVLRDKTPENIDELAKLGLVAANLGDLEFALNLADNAGGLEPVNPYSYCNLGDLYNCLGMYDKAIVSFDQAIRMNPVLVPFGLVHAFEMLGMYKKAENILDQLSLLNKKSPAIPVPAARGAILLCALPKSAGSSISDAFRTYGGYAHSETIATMNINRMPYSRISRRAFLQSVHQPVVLHTHLVATQRNIGIIRESNINKLVVHLRDPRQAVISYFYHCQYGLGLGRCLAENSQYRSLDYQNRLKWFIHHYFPLFIHWISEWLEFEPWAANYSINIKITTFEQMINLGEQAFLVDIFKFLNVPIPGDITMKRKRYRKGTTDEWRTVIDESDQQWMWDNIPEKLRERFSWSR